MTHPSRCWVLGLLAVLLICGLSRATIAAETTQITLSWDPVESTKEDEITGYNVYSVRTGEKTWKKINEEEVPQTTDPPLFGPCPVTYGVQYSFFVTAIDSKGRESGPSNMVSWPIEVFALKKAGIETYSVYPESTYTIEWYAAPKAETFRLLYSTNNGATWSIIKDGATGRSHQWTVPPLSGNKTGCLIRVIGFDSKGVKVGMANSVLPFAAEVVKFLPVNNWAPLASGTTCPISWQTHRTKNPVASITLYYTLNGSSWKKIETPEGYFESFDWQVPIVKKVSNKCKVKVVLKDAKGKTVGTDMSSAFTIYP